MCTEWISITILGFLQFLLVLVMWWEVKTTREAYLEGRILVRLRPRESSGFFNLRIENVGAGPVEDVKITFPQGFPAIPDRQQQVDLSSIIPNYLGTFGPGEFREWNVGFYADRYNSSLPDVIPYEIEYRCPRAKLLQAIPCLSKLLQAIPFLRGERKVVGQLCFSTYAGVLLNPYVGVEDIHRELKSIACELNFIRNQVRNFLEVRRLKHRNLEGKSDAS